MRRGELYRVYKASAQDPRRYRVFVVISRQTLLESRFFTAICAPVYSSFEGLPLCRGRAACRTTSCSFAFTSPGTS